VTQGYYRLLDHTADLGVEIFGATPEALFANAARTLGELLCDPQALQPRGERLVEAVGEDWADLMIDWLRELLYLWNGEQQLWADVSIETIDANRLVARVGTDLYDAARHSMRHDIKAVTYHGIEVAPAVGGWRAAVIFDV
jgi:SHS2 domain-containing protein